MFQPGKDGKPPSPVEMEARFAKFDNQQTELFRQALAFANQKPDSDEAAKALIWILEHPRAWHVPPGLPAIELLLRHHSKHSEIGPLIATLGYFLPIEEEPFHAPAMDLLQRSALGHPDRTVRGNAALGLAFFAKRRFTEAETAGGSNVDQIATLAVNAFTRLIREYGDCRCLRTRGIRAAGKNLAGEAAAELRELRDLRMGAPAPEIVATDLHGKEFRLSDHRGKVVLLVFWAAWCGPCMAEVPHEKELVKRFAGRPFVLLGVNGDQSSELARRAVKQHQIPWRSFWNGTDASGGITKDWNVRGWPAVFILDQLGMIRHKGLRGKALDQPLERLIRAAEQF